MLRASGFIESGLLGDVGFRVSFAGFGVEGSRMGFYFTVWSWFSDFFLDGGWVLGSRVDGVGFWFKLYNLL